MNLNIVHFIRVLPEDTLDSVKPFCKFLGLQTIKWHILCNVSIQLILRTVFVDRHDALPPFHFCNFYNIFSSVHFLDNHNAWNQALRMRQIIKEGRTLWVTNSHSMILAPMHIPNDKPLILQWRPLQLRSTSAKAFPAMSSRAKEENEQTQSYKPSSYIPLYPAKRILCSTWSQEHQLQTVFSNPNSWLLMVACQLWHTHIGLCRCWRGVVVALQIIF